MWHWQGGLVYIHQYHLVIRLPDDFIVISSSSSYKHNNQNIYMQKHEGSKIQDILSSQLSAVIRTKRSLNHLDVALDEVEEGTDVAVDTGVAGLGAALAPGDNTDESARGVVADGTARVTLAGVLATLVEASAEHGVGDIATVGGIALVTADDGDGDLEEVGRDATALGGSAPIL